MLATGLAEIADQDQVVIDLWLAEQSLSRTRQSYRIEADRLRCFLQGVPLKLVTTEYLHAYWPRLGERPLFRMAAIKSLLSFAHRIGYLSNNPGAEIKLSAPGPQRATRRIEPSLMRELIELEPNERNRLALKTSYYLGLGLAEVAALRWEHFQPGLVEVTRRGEQELLDVPAQLWAELLKLSEGRRRGPVFVSRTQGGPLRPTMFHRMAVRAGHRVGLDEFSFRFLQDNHWLHVQEAGRRALFGQP